MPLSDKASEMGVQSAPALPPLFGDPNLRCRRRRRRPSILGGPHWRGWLPCRLTHCRRELVAILFVGAWSGPCAPPCSPLVYRPHTDRHCAIKVGPAQGMECIHPGWRLSRERRGDDIHGMANRPQTCFWLLSVPWFLGERLGIRRLMWAVWLRCWKRLVECFGQCFAELPAFR